MKKLLIVFLFFNFTAHASPTKKNEAYFNHIYCQNIQGQEEFRLANKVRIDCLTDEFAIEMDWAKKWYEGITQALYYGMKTGKKPRLVLIMKSGKDQKYYSRALQTAKHYKLPISITTINFK